VAGPIEQEQQGVAPELEQAASARVRVGEQVGEAPVQRVGEFLGAGASGAAQAFGEPGEA
jgi:hypothetical protein